MAVEAARPAKHVTSDKRARGRLLLNIVLVGLGLVVGVVFAQVIERYNDDALLQAVVSGVALIALLIVYRRMRRARTAR